MEMPWCICRFLHRFRARSTFLWQKKPKGPFVSKMKTGAGVFSASQKIGGGSACEPSNEGLSCLLISLYCSAGHD